MNDYEKLNPNSRIWIYQSNRKFTDIECLEINVALEQFTEEWHAHQQDLVAAVVIKHQQFIILLVDESQISASGCSIDSSVRFLKGLEDKYHVQLFDRLTIAYFKDNEVKICSKTDFQRLIDEKLINQNTLVFNNLIQTKVDLNHNWLIPIEKSWHQKVFKF